MSKQVQNKIEAGHWQVIRFCCTSGQCFQCHKRGNGSREMVVQIDKISEATAKWVATNWSSYGAKAVAMPEQAKAAKA